MMSNKPKFKVGDLVTIVKKRKVNFPGLDNFVGKDYIIKKVDEDGDYHLEGNDFFWPEYTLRKAKK